MKKSAFVFAVATLGLTFAANAYDTDPGYGPDRPWSREGHREEGRWYGEEDHGPARLHFGAQEPIYYRPTMRYYGNGYTVNYRYIPVFLFETVSPGASNFRTEAFHLPTEEIPRWGANSPRLTVRDPHSPAPRVAITSIIRKTPSSTGKKAGKAVPLDALPADAPVITPDPAPAPATVPTPAPDAAAPAPPSAPVPGLTPTAPPKP